MLKFGLIIPCVLCIAGAILHTTVALAAVEGSNGVAQTNAQTSIQPSIQIVLSKQKDSAIRMEIRQAPLGQVLKAIAEKTGAIIHYSVLPEAPVTATCVGANVGQIMDCLVAKQLGLVAHKPQKDKTAEFWLLGSSVGSCQAVTVASAKARHQVASQPTDLAQNNAALDKEQQIQIEAALKQAKSKDKDERATALYNLGLLGQGDNPEVRKALEEAIADQDPNVRTQAITSLMQREGEDTPEVQQALKDKDMNVRMAVVGSLNTDIQLLQQALTDSEQSIRDLAQSKLDDMARREERLQK